MTIDPFVISTGVLALTTGGMFISRTIQAVRAQMAEEELDLKAADVAELILANNALRDRVEAFEAKEAARRARLKAISAKGHAVQSAKVKELREAAASKTLCDAKDALGRMRTRAQVVAPVKAARTRKIKQESGAGSAASTRGRG